MPLITPKRIKHLARYFGILGILCLLGYWYTDYAYSFLVFLGPPFFLVYGLRTQAGVVTNLMPNEPLFNNFLLLLPATVIYFGLLGFQLKNIFNERGFIRKIVFLAFLAFLIYIHTMAFRELSLYWEGSEKLVPLQF